MNIDSKNDYFLFFPIWFSYEGESYYILLTIINLIMFL